MLVELLSEDGGRMAAVVNGVKQKKSKLAGSLRPFNSVLVKLSGKTELKTLCNVESTNQSYPLSGIALYCGFYINEISFKLLAKGEGGGDLFSCYAQTLEHLNDAQSRDLYLRYFEYALLREIGLAFDLQCDLNSHKIKATQYYVHIRHQGLLKSKESNPNAISGECILNFTNHKALDKPCLNALKKLTREMLDQALEGRLIKSRELLADYVRVKSASV